MDKSRILNDFLPDKIFDAHMHLYDASYMNSTEDMPKSVGLEDYYRQMREVFLNRKISVNIIPYPSRKIISDPEKHLASVDTFLYRELGKDIANVGELLVMPNETESDILARIKSNGICGFKCYHLLNPSDRTADLDIKDYLPESAFVLANEYKKVITLHLVKDAALSDEENLNYITEMAKKYPNAILILAHAARAFAAWTGFESVEKLKNIENVWFDFSAVCESPAMFQIIKKCGAERVVWGSDYPITEIRGRAVSIADKFFWICDYKQPEISKSIKMWKYVEENLMAIRQVAIMADLTSRQVEDIFYNNAKSLFSMGKDFQV